ncbi:MAG: hypothetical protein ABJH45_16360 [Paracoccaceae bacterium]
MASFAIDEDLGLEPPTSYVRPNADDTFIVPDPRKLTQLHIYETVSEIKGSAKFSILGKDWGVSGKKKAFFREARRVHIDKLPDGTKVASGVSVRLKVLVVDWNTEIDFTVPNIAAKAQLGGVSARAHLGVHGYAGSLGLLIQVQDDFGVERGLLH